MKKKKRKIYRQPIPNRIVHWGIAISTFMLIITGLGQMPLYGRYLLVQPPGTKWLTSYEITLWVHYIFAALLMFFVMYHIVFHIMMKQFNLVPKKGDVKGSIILLKAMLLRKEEPPSEKYLPEQRLTYAYFVFAFAVIIISGFLKVFKNMVGVQPSNGLLLWGAQLHNVSTVLIVVGVVMHILALIVKDNRPLLPGIFTGYVNRKYVKERHSLWYDELKDKE